MIENKNEVKIYLFDFHKNAYVREFENEEELINFLAKTYHCSFFGEYRNPYIDSINMNGNDTETFYNIFDVIGHTVRKYLFIDKNNRIIDVRKYKDVVLERYKALREKKEKDQENFWTSLSHGDKLYVYDGTPYRYRMDPVPHLIRRRGCSWLRHMRTTQELRQNSIPEYKEYVHSKRNYIPTLYDDIPRETQRCWKAQSKKRKQWM